MKKPLSKILQITLSKEKKALEGLPSAIKRVAHKSLVRTRHPNLKDQERGSTHVPRNRGEPDFLSVARRP